MYIATFLLISPYSRTHYETQVLICTCHLKVNPSAELLARIIKSRLHFAA